MITIAPGNRRDSHTMHTMNALPSVWDCHTHIFGPWATFPLPDNPTYVPEEAPFQQLRELHAGMGVTRGVIVQAAAYGGDHRALLAAMAASKGAYRGIAAIEPDTEESVLQSWHAQGIRGIRLSLMPHLKGNLDLGRLRAMMARVLPLGWHALVHGEIQTLAPLLPDLHATGLTLVIDHMARGQASEMDGANKQAMSTVLAHLEDPAVWIKLSGADRISAGKRPFSDSLPVMRRFLAAAPERAIWGTDWPHVNLHGDTPDTASLLDLVLEACGDAQSVEAVLSRNPAVLYA